MPESSRGLMLVISGPSGAGKTTIAHEVEKRLGGAFSISATTRPKAPTDVEGRDYYFLTDEEFNRRREAGEFLEWAQVFEQHFYGTPRKPVEEHLSAGRLVILEIDVQGGLQVKRAMPQAYMIFILPPDDEALPARLRGRGRDDDAAIQRRLKKANDEIERARSSGAYDDFVVNRNLDRAVQEVCELVKRRWGRSQESSCAT